jgi:hypothetical protein
LLEEWELITVADRRLEELGENEKVPDPLKDTLLLNVPEEEADSLEYSVGGGVEV